jgi:PAS domain S-box-containing protein
MPKVKQLFGGLSQDRAAGVGLLGPRAARLLNCGQAIGLTPETLLTVAGLVVIGVIGWINLRTVRGLRFELFYLLVCALVGWVAGARAALVCTLLSGVCLYLGESAVAARLDWVFAGNALLGWLAFAAAGGLAAEVARLSRELKRTVEQPTTRVESVVEEHGEAAELLRETVQLFKQVTGNITDVIWVTAPANGQVDYVSPAFETLWGESCETLYASPATWLAGVHPEDRERVADATARKQITGEYDEEYRVVRPDGSLRWVHDRAFPVKNEAGAVYRLVGIAADITERKRNEHLLQVQRNVAIALGSTSNLGFALDRLLEIALQLEGIDCGGVYLLNQENGDLHLNAHRGLSDVFVERISRYAADSREARLMKGGGTVYLRQEQIPRDPGVLWGGEGLRALAVVPVQHQGAVLGMLNLASFRQDDIPAKTRVGIELIASQVAGAIARIRAEESSRRSEAHVRTIVNSAPIALLAADASGTITFEDGQALSSMGVKPGEHLRRPMAEVYADFPLMLENVRRALAGEEFSSVLEFAETVFDCRFTPVRDKGRQPAGFIAVAIDVTERIRLEREILEISDREQARIGQDVHDGLCQQLIGVTLKANSLEQSLAAQQRQEAATARKICGLLDEAITESRRVCRGLYPIRLRTEGLVPALEELAGTTNERHPVKCRCEADRQGLHCDVTTATHLYRIAQEALNNALKHSGASNLVIQLTESEGAIVLQIKDDGKGLGPPDLRSAPERGSGMGLHIMDYRARLIGGSLQLQSDRNGTTVSCRVPQNTH